MNRILCPSSPLTAQSTQAKAILVSSLFKMAFSRLNSTERHAAIQDTWGRAVCNDLLFLTGNATESRLVQLESGIYNLQVDIEDHNVAGWMKMRTGLNFIFHKWLKPFYWMLCVDDEGFLFVDNFRTFVQSLDMEKPLMFGAYYANYFGDHVGTGPGILLNHLAIEQLKQSFNKNACSRMLSSISSSFGDVKLSTCLKMAKVAKF